MWGISANKLVKIKSKNSWENIKIKQLEQYLKNYNILSEYQSGFRKRYSCEAEGNYVITGWKNISKNKKVMAIFLAFWRSFETIETKTIQLWSTE